jgi:hypothetical protein
MRYIKTYEEIKTINYILSVNEGLINEGLIDRLKKMATKGLLTATVMASLMSNPTFANEYKSLPGSEKASIENLVKTPTNEVGKDVGSEDVGSREIDITKSFKSGKYSLDEVGKEELGKKLVELVDYMNKAGYDSYTFDISASESLVPNKSGSGLKDLELAQKRADEVKTYVNEFLKKNKTPGVVVCTDVTKGGPKWNGKEDVNQEKFTKHQFVKINIVPLAANPNDFCGFSYDPGGAIAGSNKTFDKEWDVTDKYGSGDIILKPGAIPDRILLYADGQLIGDTGFFADKEHSVTKKLGFDYVPKTVYELTKLYNEKDVSVQDTEFSKLKVVTINSEEELIHLLNPNDPTRWNTNNPDIAPMGDLIKMFKQGQRKFVIYEKTPSKISFDLKGKYKKVKLIVYSNIKKSQYSIKVKCSK